MTRHGSRVEILFILGLFALRSFAADQKAAEPKPDNLKTATAISTETADVIRQTVAKVTALGEAGRLCVAVLANDQKQIREIQSKIQQLDTVMANLKHDMYRLYQTRTQRQQLDYNTDYNKLDNQGKAAQSSRNALTADLNKFIADANNQQTCINRASTALAKTISNPSETIQARQNTR